MSASLHDQPSLLLLCLGRFWKPYWHDCFVVVFTMPVKQTTLHLKLALLWPAWWVTLGLQALRFPTLTQGCFPAFTGRSVYTHSQASPGWTVNTAPGNGTQTNRPSLPKLGGATEGVASAFQNPFLHRRPWCFLCGWFWAQFQNLHIYTQMFGVHASTIGHSTKPEDLHSWVMTGNAPPALNLLLRSSHIRRCQLQCLPRAVGWNKRTDPWRKGPNLDNEALSTSQAHIDKSQLILIASCSEISSFKQPRSETKLGKPLLAHTIT